MFQLATAAIFLLSTFYGVPVADAKPLPTGNADNDAQHAPFVAQPFTLEEYVREYFHDEPVLAEIAKCESRFRHTDQRGKVLRGEASAEDLGVMQINEFYHEERALKLGFNLHTLDGNLAYARWLYGREGTAPWFASKNCWQRAETLARANGIGRPATN